MSDAITNSRMAHSAESMAYQNNEDFILIEDLWMEIPFWLIETAWCFQFATDFPSDIKKVLSVKKCEIKMS